MKKLNTPYLVKDKSGREWGLVIFTKEEAEYLHGYLEPTTEFNKLLPLFKLHDQQMTEGMDKYTEKEVNSTAIKIAQLNVTLLEINQNTFCEAGIVFIQETKKGLLFSCGS